MISKEVKNSKRLYKIYEKSDLNDSSVHAFASLQWNLGSPALNYRNQGFAITLKKKLHRVYMLHQKKRISSHPSPFSGSHHFTLLGKTCRKSFFPTALHWETNVFRRCPSELDNHVTHHAQRTCSCGEGTARNFGFKRFWSQYKCYGKWCILFLSLITPELFRFSQRYYLIYVWSWVIFKMVSIFYFYRTIKKKNFLFKLQKELIAARHYARHIMSMGNVFFFVSTTKPFSKLVALGWFMCRICWTFVSVIVYAFLFNVIKYLW